MLLVKLFKLGIAFIVVAAALTTTTMAQELEETPSVERTRLSEEGNPEQDRATRVQQYREQATEQLSETRQERLRNRCDTAQARLQSVLEQDRIKADARIEAHTKVTTGVQRVVNAVEAAGVDATALQQASEDLQSRSNEVVSALRTYVTAIEDIVSLDCTADVEGFQAGLSLARQERASLRTLASSFREYVKNDVKAALQQIKSELSTE